MKIFITTILFTFITVQQAQAGFLSGLLDRRGPSQICTEEIKRHYEAHVDLIHGCNKHTTKYANKCVDILIRSNAQMHPESTHICSFQNSKYGVKAMEEFSYRYELSVLAQLLISFVETKEEAECVINLSYAQDLRVPDLQKCVENTNQEISERQKETLGLTTIGLSEDEEDSRFSRFIDNIRGIFN